MTVNLVITDSSDNDSYVHIAFQRNFTDHWVRGCSTLNLKWVPRFTGIELEQEDLPAVLEELARLKHWMQSPENNVPTGIISQVDTLISNLEQLRGTNYEIWIG